MAWHRANIAALQASASALSEKEMEEKLAEALKGSGIKFTDNEDAPMDADDVADALINPEGEGLPLFVGNETLAPFVELARGRVFSLRVVVPMA